jgi:hypothetical protein
MDAIGVEGNFKIKAAKVANVEATIKHHQRYILYNPAFIEQVNAETNNKWAAIFILAHEVAHHIEGHTLVDIRERPVVELQADQFAGYTLRRMGASLAQAQLAIHYIANAEPSKTHPGRETRLAAIQRGWERAQSQLASLATKSGNDGKTTGAPN